MEGFVVSLWLLFCSSLTACTVITNSGSGSDPIDSGSGIGPTLPPPVYQDPPVTYGNLTCDQYYDGVPQSVCQQVFSFTSFDVINNHSRGTFSAIYEDVNKIFTVLGGSGSPTLCSRIAAPLLCYFQFPFCDPAFRVPVFQPMCRWDCELIRDFVCPVEWNTMKKLEGILGFGVVDRFNCELLDDSNAGDAPMCISTLDNGVYSFIMKDFSVPGPVYTPPYCYNGKGRGYTGQVSVTESGHTCQVWGTRCPHPNYILPQQYWELYSPVTGQPHNYCRNPGERGERPWCFTTNRTVRWEYCNIPKCAPGPTCERYTGSICRTNGSIGMEYIYINTSIATQLEYEQKLKEVLNVLSNFPDCLHPLISFLCHSTFPLCDMSYPTPRPRKVCTSYCESVRPHCAAFFSELEDFLSFSNLHPLEVPTNCTRVNTAPKAAGTAPECYDVISATQEVTNETTCYNSTARGVNYIGTINVTVSGLPCQPWDLQEPHPHPFTPLFRSYLAEHNYCRNPEGRGLLPWCYTTNSSVRWEYCDVPACSVAMTTEPPHTSLPNWVIPSAGAGGGALVAVAITLFIIACACYCCCRGAKSYAIKDGDLAGAGRGADSYYLSTVNPTVRDTNNPLYCPKPALTGSYFDYTNNVKLPEYNREKLTYICDLGEGHFGLVIRAEAEGVVPGNDKCTVAVKVLKEGASSTARAEFFKEAALMAGFDHGNILKLLGVCIEQEPLCMIFEYMEMGDLNNFLRQNAPAHLHSFPCSGPKTLPQGISTKNLVDIAKDIACGLSYLATHHYVHRDLATRNCLVNRNLKVKIADFGLSQDVYSNDYFRLGESELLPIRWMPPEAIMFSKFTIDSDVWSYGVVLWEIFSYGMQPYYGMSNEEVIKYVRDDNVLRRPQGTPQEIYDLMLDCWNVNPTERPKATEIADGLERWTPDLSAQIEVQAKHPDYQNMSTILEWARRNREVGQYHLLENPENTGDGGPALINGAPPTNTNGAPPTNTNEAPPTNTNGVPPTNITGVPPTNINGAPPTNTNRAPPTNGAYDHLSPPTNNNDKAAYDLPIY